MTGVPVTVTASLKVIVIGIVSSNLYAPSLELELTEAIVGSTPSTTIAFALPSELAAPGAAKVKVDALPAPSLMVPPFNARAFVLT